MATTADAVAESTGPRAGPNRPLWAVPSTRDRTLVTPSRWVMWLDWMARFDITVVPGASWCMVDRDGTVLEGREARQFVKTRLPATFLFSRFWRYR